MTEHAVGTSGTINYLNTFLDRIKLIEAADETRLPDSHLKTMLGEYVTVLEDVRKDEMGEQRRARTKAVLDRLRFELDERNGTDLLHEVVTVVDMPDFPTEVDSATQREVVSAEPSNEYV